MNTEENLAINPKYIIFLSLSFLMIYLVSDALAYKMIAFHPISGYELIIPAPPLLFPISYAILDIIAELYGKRITYQLVFQTLFLQTIFALILSIVAYMPSPSGWAYQQSYEDVFNNILRFVTAGLFATLTGNIINIHLFSKWKFIMRGKHFWLRSMFSSIFGGFFLVLIIVFFGYADDHLTLYDLKMFANIYVIEIAYAVVLAMPAWFVVNLIKIRQDRIVYENVLNEK